MLPTLLRLQLVFGRVKLSWAPGRAPRPEDDGVTFPALQNLVEWPYTHPFYHLGDKSQSRKLQSSGGIYAQPRRRPCVSPLPFPNAPDHAASSHCKQLHSASPRHVLWLCTLRHRSPICSHRCFHGPTSIQRKCFKNKLSGGKGVL